MTPVITTSGTTWAQFKTGGLKYILDKLVATAGNTAKTDPSTTATGAVTTATGGLAAGDYLVSYTFNDAYGETLVGGRSAAITVAGITELATITLPAKPTGVHSMNLYVTPPNGVAGTELLYATGITGTTFACTPTLAADAPGACLPLANTTGAAGCYQKIYALLNGNPEIAMNGIQEWYSEFLSGRPMQLRDQFRIANRHHGVILTWAQVLKEANVLMAANVGTFTPSQGAIYATVSNVFA